jgi:hypothetical protein
LLQSIMTRVPTHEPYPHHENLDPTKFKPAMTDRDAAGRTLGNVSLASMLTAWNEYTTRLDTFERMQAPNEEE